MVNQKKWLVRKIYHYSKLIGLKDSFLFTISELLKQRNLMLINIAGEQVYIRTSTHDLHVAATCLIDEEYSNIKTSNPAIIIDAGAYIGTSAIYFAKKYPNATIFAIEPEQENYEIMLKNIYKYTNIKPIKAALYDQRETRMLHDRFTGPWGYTISETQNHKATTGQKIECITINSILDKYNLPYIDILKIDIEGSEKNVLENSSGWINKVGIITAELHDRICMGCDRAFYLATKDFLHFEKHGEKVTAYRQLWQEELNTQATK